MDKHGTLLKIEYFPLQTKSHAWLHIWDVFCIYWKIDVFFEFVKSNHIFHSSLVKNRENAYSAVLEN